MTEQEHRVTQAGTEASAGVAGEQTGRLPDVSTKRFFRVDDDGHVQYSMVARDEEHAKELFRVAGVLFGPDEVGIDKATPMTTPVTPETLTDADRKYWWTPPVEPEFLTDRMILDEMAKLNAERRVDAVDECELALGVVGRWPNGLVDCRTGKAFDVFEARRRVCGHINSRAKDSGNG